MITKLTKKQKEKIPLYFEKWNKIGKEYQPINQKKAKEYLREYLLLINKKPTIFIKMSSPLGCQVAINKLKQLDNELGRELGSELDKKLYNELDRELDNELDKKLYNELGRELNNELFSKLGNELGNKLCTKLDNELDKKLYNELYKKLDKKLDKKLSSELYNELSSELYKELERELNNKLGRELNNEFGNELYKKLDKKLDSELGTKLDNELYNKLSSELYNELGRELVNELDNKLYNELYNKLKKKLFSELGNEFKNKLYDELDKKLYDELGRELGSELYYNWFYQCGNINAGYCAFYDFLIEEVKKPTPKLLKIWNIFKKISEYFHYFYCFDNIVFYSEKPITLKFNANNQLHNENGMAVEYADGWGFYSLNGVSVPEWLVTEKWNKIDPMKFAEIENAEIRREFVRKVGIERIVQKCGCETLDKHGDYELILVDLKDTKEKRA